jgi:hypothetical protein
MKFKKINVFIGEQCDNYIKYLKQSNIPKNFILDSNCFNFTPKTQHELLINLMRKRNEFGYIYIPTHSPYVLNILNNLITAKECLKKANCPKDIVKKYEDIAIDFEEVAAFKIEEGKIKSILDKKNKLINNNSLDDISDTLSKEFDNFLDCLYPIRRKND